MAFGERQTCFQTIAPPSEKCPTLQAKSFIRAEFTYEKQKRP